MNIHINTTDLRWAIGFAGAIVSAKNDTNAKLNKNFEFSFERTTPEISIIADYFAQKAKDSVTVTPPTTEEEFKDLDVFSALNHKLELEEQHGILQELVIQPLNYSGMAAAILTKQCGVSCKPGFFYPKVSKSLLQDVDRHWDAIVTSPEYVEKVKRFLIGKGIPDPQICDCSGLPLIEQIKLLAIGLKIVGADAEAPIFAVMRSQYKGFDYMSETTPALCMLAEELNPDSRFIVSWGAHIPIFAEDTLDSIEEKGKAWGVREKFKFDHHAFEREVAKMRKAGAK